MSTSTPNPSPPATAPLLLLLSHHHHDDDGDYHRYHYEYHCDHHWEVRELLLWVASYPAMPLRNPACLFRSAWHCRSSRSGSLTQEKAETCHLGNHQRLFKAVWSACVHLVGDATTYLLCQAKALYEEAQAKMKLPRQGRNTSSLGLH